MVVLVVVLDEVLDPPGGAVVVVVVLEKVVVVLDEVVVVVVVVLGVLVVVVVLLGVVVDGAGGLMMCPTEVPLPPPPKMAERGLPEISSTAVMKASATTNTRAAVPARAFQLMRRRAGVKCLGRGAGCHLVASRRSVGGAEAAAPTCSSISLTAVASFGADEASTEDAALPLGPVPPSRRNKGDPSGVRTTTCLTARCPRSIDCETNAVPSVAAIDPMATPTMVPVTPKLDAMTAAITAPAADARICRPENFTATCSRHRPPAPRRRMSPAV